MWTTRPRSDLGGGLVGYRVGRGPRLVLLHGVGMRAEFWNALVPGLTPHFTVTVPDLPGHGSSPRRGTTSANLSHYGDVLAEVLSSPGTPWIVVGHSLGALLALDLAARHAPLIGGLGVVNGIHRRSEAARAAVRERATEIARASSPNASPTDSRTTAPANTRSPFNSSDSTLDSTSGSSSDSTPDNFPDSTPDSSSDSSSDSTPDSSATLRRWFGDDPDGADRAAAEACRRWLAEVDPAGYRDAYRVFAESDTPDDDALRGIGVPALVATGALETNSTPSMARTLTTLLPDARCLVVEGARHMMPMTHGEALLTALIARFHGVRPS